MGRRFARLVRGSVDWAESRLEGTSQVKRKQVFDRISEERVAWSRIWAEVEF